MKPLLPLIGLIFLLPIAFAITIGTGIYYSPSGGGNFTFLQDTTASEIDLQDSYFFVNVSSDTEIYNIGATQGNLSIASDTPRNIYNITDTKAIMLASNKIEYNMTVNAGEKIGIGCVIPYGNITLINDTKLCAGSYQINATSTSTGAITIGASNVELDGNGAEIIGNTTGRGISGTTTSRSGITIKNFKVSNYTNGIYVNRESDSLIEYNVVENCVLSNPNAGIVLGSTDKTKGKNNTIINNNITNCYLGISISTGNNNISNNNILNTNYSSIRVTYPDNYIGYNFINLSGWNTLDIDTNNSIIEFNTGINPLHHCLDSYDSSTYNILVNNSWLNNTCIWTNTDTDSNGLYLRNASDNYFYGNKFYNVPSSTTNGVGMDITGGDFSENNLFVENWIYDASVNSIISSAKNSTFQNNHLVGYEIIKLDSSQGYLSSGIFMDNYIDSGIVSYLFADEVNVTINETSSIQHIINLSNNGIVYFNYNGRKDLQVENNTIRILSMLTPYNQIFMNNQTTPLYENTGDINFSVNGGNTTFVFSYAEADDPKLSSLATTITAYQMSYVEGTSLSINCTGSGTHIITNMDDIGGYAVYHNGVYVETEATTSYTMTSCSDWEFIATDTLAHSPEGEITIDNITDSLSNLIRVFALAAGLFIAGFVFVAFLKGDIEIEEFGNFIFMLLLAAIGIVILLAFLNGW